MTRDLDIDRRGVLALIANAVSSIAFSPLYAQSAPRAGVLYEESERFRPIFDETIRGISDGVAGDRLERFLIRPGITQPEIDQWLAEPRAHLFVLGAKAAEAVKRSNGRQRAVIGLTYLSGARDEGASGVSLEFAPQIAFREMRNLFPDIDRVQLVVSKSFEPSLRPELTAAANNYGFDLVLSEVSSLSEATDAYLNILKYGNPKTDFLWFLGEHILGTADTYPQLIEIAWNQRFPIFSSKRGLVDQGVLIGAEPDFFATGQQLARLSVALSDGEMRVETTQVAKLVLNARVARRLHIGLTNELRQRVDLVVADD